MVTANTMATKMAIVKEMTTTDMLGTTATTKMAVATTKMAARGRMTTADVSLGLPGTVPGSLFSSNRTLSR
jgi:hypothetical protein